MHHGNADKSRRLLRVLGVLSDGMEHSTAELSRKANTYAASTAVSELRANGHRVDCRVSYRNGSRIWLYRLDRRA